MVTFLCLFCILASETSEIKYPLPDNKQVSPIVQKLRYTVVGTSLLAIASDGLVEYYYRKYQDEDGPGWCKKYRERTQLCEKIRDVSVWSAGISLVSYIVVEKFASKSQMPCLPAGKKSAPTKTQGFLNKLDFKFTDKKVELRIRYEI